MLQLPRLPTPGGVETLAQGGAEPARGPVASMVDSSPLQGRGGGVGCSRPLPGQWWPKAESTSRVPMGPHVKTLGGRSDPVRWQGKVTITYDCKELTGGGPENSSQASMTARKRR